ncbi:MAG: tRNA (5-methylaminomethyl-2-thiouridine)(34)-methyltransferase MnmD [Chitinophagales bacterium]|nr:tRNA (5-methylaminomethyl-2-thiouridine)(34)-methyltransferase MnmD [Chitinophagales bacterium]
MTQLIITADGSHTLFAPQFDEHYHSVHGAIAESEHVFLNAGFAHLPQHLPLVRILEMGFGTGLNAFLTCLAAKNQGRTVCYTAIEAYPIAIEQALRLNYAEQLGLPNQQPLFEALHRAAPNQQVAIQPHFCFCQQVGDLLSTELPDAHYHLVYYDAFAPTSQPELWTSAVFEQLYHALLPQGILVTYCAKGSVKRALRAVGFVLETLPGPPRKREMTRATKP